MCLRGTAIPEIIAETSVGYNTGGALIGFTYFGFFFGTLSSVFLLKKLQAPLLMGAAVITACAGLGVFSLAVRVGMMFIAAFLIGTGGGLIDVTANLTVRMSADKSKLGQRLNQLAFFHGTGAIVSPLFAGIILSLTAQWRRIYFFAALLTAVLVLIILILVKQAGVQKTAAEEKTEKLEYESRCCPAWRSSVFLHDSRSGNIRLDG